MTRFGRLYAQLLQHLVVICLGESLNAIPGRLAKRGIDLAEHQ
jgi:hypothetical protein